MRLPSPHTPPRMNMPMFRRLVLLTLSALLLSGCGFHLRRSAQLAPALQRMHLDVSGDNALTRELATSLRLSNVTLEDHGGPGIATLRVPVNSFNTQALTLTGYASVSEYVVYYRVEFEVLGADGKLLIPLQTIRMSRDFTFSPTQVIGNAGQQTQIQRGLVDDMAQAILMRLQAQGGGVAGMPATASSAPATPGHD
jgi:LPS-assembly lipoprotein